MGSDHDQTPAEKAEAAAQFAREAEAEAKESMTHAAEASKVADELVDELGGTEYDGPGGEDEEAVGDSTDLNPGGYGPGPSGS